MKLNTTLFLCISFSAIIITEAGSDEYEYYDEDDGQNYVENEIVGNNFQYKPSERLQQIENQMSAGEKEFVQDGKVKETMTNTFFDSMNTDVAVDGLSELDQKWQKIIEGSEASWVIGTFGGNVNRIFTSPEGADMISILASTAHVLLSKAGEGDIARFGLVNILSMTFSLFTSPKMPDIVNKAGELVNTAVNKPMASSFVKQYWYELKNLLLEKDLNIKLDNYFVNLAALMKSFRSQTTPVTVNDNKKIKQR